MTTIKILWQRLVDEEGQTCTRCRGTEAQLEQAVRFLEMSLAPAGVNFVVEKKALPKEEVALDPLISNRILIDGRPLEQWLGAQVGQSACCGPCEGWECRTLVRKGQVYEIIPAEEIIRAALMAVEHHLRKDPAR